MRTFNRVGLAAVMIGAAIVGCSGESHTGPTELSVDGELAQLRQRIGDLTVAVQAAGRMTPELQAEVLSIQEGVEHWQARSGRHDISVTRSVRRTPEAGSSSVSAAQRGDPNPGSCPTCPTITVMNGHVCFLVSYGCNPGQIISHWCEYVCFQTLSVTAG
jgi:hypothetical protein